MSGTKKTPEREMARRALGPGAAAVILVFLAGTMAGGAGVGSSAALGVGVILANFIGNALALAWARGVSLVAIQAVAYGGFLVRMGIVLGLLFGLRVFSWFDVAAFGLAALGSAVLLLAYESTLVLGGLGADFDLSEADSSGSGEPAPRSGAGSKA